MNINKYDLLSLTSNKKVYTTNNANITSSETNISNVVSDDTSVLDLDVATINGVNIDLFGDVSDEKLTSLYSKNNSSYKTTIRFATTYKSFTPAEMHQIKAVIYNMHKSSTSSNVSPAANGTGSNGTSSGSGTNGTGNTGSGSGTDGTNGTGNTGSGSGTDGTNGTGNTGSGSGTDGTNGTGNSGSGSGTDGTNETGNTGSETGSTGDGSDSSSSAIKSFIKEFGDTISMFEWLNKQDSSITYETGITRAQLVALTQNDDWEDSNYDFFGCLNRIFNVLDKDSDSILSASEIEELIGEELGEDYNDYLMAVNTYAQQISDQYKNMSDQEKLQFAIDRTREYFEAMGMTRQTEALERLLSGTDTYNDIKVGQIALADLGGYDASGYMTLGAYTYLVSYQSTYDDSNEPGKPYNISYFDSDEDTKKYDLGITLNLKVLDWNWYKLVDTLVHEVTHATAYQYKLTLDQVEEFYNNGYITDTEYDYYKDNWDNIVADYYNGYKNEYMQRLIYLIGCQFGEYAAYQVDADYCDSIGADVLDSGKMTTAVNGESEKETIIKHVEDGYNNTSVSADSEDYHKEALPDYKWESYG
jgi:hypothetical protein